MNFLLKKLKQIFRKNPTIQFKPITWNITQDTNSTLTIADKGDVIMSLLPNGEIRWHKNNIHDRAVQIFLDSLNFHIEDRAGIKETRKEWETRIVNKVYKTAKRLKTQTLTPEQVYDVMKKEIMFDRLAGK